MKKTTVVLLTLAGMAAADTITIDNTFYTNPNSWVYAWDASDAKWKVSKNLTDTDLKDHQAPSSEADPVFIGYEFSSDNGVQTMTATDTAITLAAPSWWSSKKGVYIGNNVTITGADNGINAGVKFHFSDITTSVLGYTGRMWKRGDISVTGSLTLDNTYMEHVFFTANSMEQNVGIWDFSGFSVTDANGNALTYTTEAENIGKAGYFWVETAEYQQFQPYYAKLVAKAIPEPTTATLSLLALAGLAARRRRAAR